MLTARAWWLLATDLLLLVLGLLGGIPPISLLAIAILLWFIWEAVRFSFYKQWVIRNLSVHRSIQDDRGPVLTLWAGRRFHIRTTVQINGKIRLPYAHVEEPLPFGTRLDQGSTETDGPISPTEGLEMRYDIRPPSAGSLRFEGVKVRIADLQGLFFAQWFVRDLLIVKVLPSLVNLDTHTATKKRQNTLMPPGIHHLAAPGSGSELLDLRDYIPGDPPKTIAWKVSARRDKLITKEYESEVPVRCTVFVDSSSAVLLGPPGQAPICRLAEIAASVTQANMGSRDLTGLCLFDENGTRVIRPARNRRHLIQVLHLLAEAASKKPDPGEGDAEALLPLTYTYAQEVYPELMTQSVNRMPAWLPFVSPTPDRWAKPAGPVRMFFRLFSIALLSLIYLLFFGLLYALVAQDYYAIPQRVVDFVSNKVLKGEPIQITSTWSDLLPPLGVFFLAYWTLIFLLLPLWLKFFRDMIPMLFMPRKRRMMRYRKKMAALLSQHYELGPGGIETLFQEEQALAGYLQRFLQEHQVPFTPSLYDREGRYRYAQPDKLLQLKKALLTAVGKGRDNELFVICVDLVEMEQHLEPFLAAVKVALARHHQVMLLFPWPVDFPLPDEQDPDPGAPPSFKHRLRKERKKGPTKDERLLQYLNRLAYRHYVGAFQRVRQTFARLHVPVVCAADEHSVKLILERLDRLRKQQRQKIVT